jgi:hypothetical protein
MFTARAPLLVVLISDVTNGRLPEYNNRSYSVLMQIHPSLHSKSNLLSSSLNSWKGTFSDQGLSVPSTMRTALWCWSASTRYTIAMQ